MRSFAARFADRRRRKHTVLRFTAEITVEDVTGVELRASEAADHPQLRIAFSRGAKHVETAAMRWQGDQSGSVSAHWGEVVPLRVTLYRDDASGRYQSKEWRVQLATCGGPRRRVVGEATLDMAMLAETTGEAVELPLLLDGAGDECLLRLTLRLSWASDAAASEDGGSSAADSAEADGDEQDLSGFSGFADATPMRADLRLPDDLPPTPESELRPTDLSFEVSDAEVEELDETVDSVDSLGDDEVDIPLDDSDGEDTELLLARTSALECALAARSAEVAELREKERSRPERLCLFLCAPLCVCWACFQDLADATEKFIFGRRRVYETVG